MIQLGTVTAVTVEDQVLVRVNLGPDRERREVVFLGPAKGMFIVPEIGDTVELYELSGGQPFARYPHTAPDFSPPSMSEGDIAIKLNEDTVLKFQKQSDGTYNLTVDVDGDLTLNADGQITLGDSGSANEVARKGDPVEVSDPDSGTITGSITDGSNKVDAE